jgi:hypothetical protein
MGSRPGERRRLECGPSKPVALIAIVAVIVAAPMIVAVHVHANAPVGVIARAEGREGGEIRRAF